MIKKYNVAINVSFWILIAAIITIFALIIFMPDLKMNSYLFGKHKEVIIKKEPVVIKEYKEIEKNIEWFYFVATGYSKNDANQGTDNTTATGKEVFEGIIAVDPKVIPFGTVLEIKDMGYFIAEDCGGKIKGNRIDIYFGSKEEAKKFGNKGVWVRFLDENVVELADLNYFK
jgi:3D (Asp-Asp-Asp) domain-containing protein